MSKIVIERLSKMNITRSEMIKNGFSSQKYDDVCRGKSSYKIDDLIKISEKFQLSLDYLIKGMNIQGNTLTDTEKNLLEVFNKLSSDDQIRISERAETLAELAAERAVEQKKEQRTEPIHAANTCLPLNDTCKIRYYDRAASAGTGLFLDEAIAETLTVQSTPEAQQADYAIPVSGDSMEEEYHDGDIVLVKSCPCVRKGEVGIFLLDGSVYIKEYGGKFLISYNEDYPPIDLSKYETAACLGKVIGIADVNY